MGSMILGAMVITIMIAQGGVLYGRERNIQASRGSAGDRNCISSGACGQPGKVVEETDASSKATDNTNQIQGNSDTNLNEAPKNPSPKIRNEGVVIK